MIRKIISRILIIGGLIGMCYPFTARIWNGYRQQTIATEYKEGIEKEDPASIQSAINAAEEYNRKLYASGVNHISQMEHEKSEEYEALLNKPDGMLGMMGYLQIDKIGVDIPIYHYSFDEQLSEGTGHIHGTSLPVGGENTHSVITGHRGLPTNKMLTDLDQMEVGDHFVLHILDRELYYEVDQIKVVEPEKMDDLSIIGGEDHVTLLTCTPYGINDHRLLVRGVRIYPPVEPDKKPALISKDSLRSSEWPAYACFFAAVFIITALIIRSIRGRKNS